MPRTVSYARLLAAAWGLSFGWASGVPVFAENGWRFDGEESPVDPSTGPGCGLVATGPGGEVYYTYCSVEAGSADIFFTRSLDFGSTWSPPVKIDTDAPGMNSSLPTDLMATPDGDVLVFFLDSRGGMPGQAARVNISMDRGETWLASDLLVRGGTSSGAPHVSLGAPDVLFVSSGRYLLVSRNSGQDWSELRQFPGIILVSSDDLGNVYVIWRTPDDIYAEASHDSGETWSSIPVLLNVNSATSPRITSDLTGNVYVATLRRNKSGTFTPFAHVSNDFGDTYTTPLSLVGEFSSISGPELAADCAGNVVTSFAFGPAWINRSHDFGRTWLLEPQLLEPPDAFSVFSAVDMTNDGHVFLAYSSVREDGRKIWFNASVDAGRTFLANDILSSISGADNPAIVADGQGHVYITYQTILADLLRSGRADLGIGLASGLDQATFLRVPPEGGRVSLAGVLRNQTVATVFTGVPATLEVLREDGSVLGTIASKTFNIRPGAERVRSLSLRVPGCLPSGLYRWRLRIGSPNRDHATVCMKKEE